MSNGAVYELPFFFFLRCPSGHSTSIPVNLVYFPKIQISELIASLHICLK